MHWVAMPFREELVQTPLIDKNFSKKSDTNTKKYQILPNGKQIDENSGLLKKYQPFDFIL